VGQLQLLCPGANRAGRERHAAILLWPWHRQLRYGAAQGHTITETSKLQFRADAFDIFNHTQFQNSPGNYNNSGLGGFAYVVSARDPRIMQVALKFLF
jgi:hypothetical protein